MGRCENAIASIGIKISLCDLLEQINEVNFEQIKTILEEGFLEDENEAFNELYHTIIFSNSLPDDYLIVVPDQRYIVY